MVETIEYADRVGLMYVTLAGHPERGAEEFVDHLFGDDGRFEVRAVSQPAFWGSRLLPFPGRKVQPVITDRYLKAAGVIAAARA